MDRDRRAPFGGLSLTSGTGHAVVMHSPADFGHATRGLTTARTGAVGWLAIAMALPVIKRLNAGNSGRGELDRLLTYGNGPRDELSATARGSPTLSDVVSSVALP